MRVTMTLAIVALTCGAATSRPTNDDRGLGRGLDRNKVRSELNLDSLGDTFVLAQAPVSNRCFTPYFSCLLPGYAPLGTACWCATPNGPVAGVVR